MNVHLTNYAQITETGKRNTQVKKNGFTLIFIHNYTKYTLKQSITTGLQ